MHDFVNTPLGWFHLCSAIVSLVSGTYILFKTKGTKLHKQIGYLYVIYMVLVCFSALGVYNITGDFGVFHILAFAALITLALGLTPLYLQQKYSNYKVLHLWFMYYSVIGLYAALFSELSIRIPDNPSYKTVGLTTCIVFIIGTYFIRWKENNWSKILRKKI